MTPELHSKLQEIFEAALVLDGAEREAYLEQACAGDAEMRRRVEELLNADDETVFMAEPSTAATARAVLECPQCRRCYQSPQATCPGDGKALEFAFDGPQLIDSKYLVERRLGKGGMGAVYLVQHIGLEKRFALKLIAHDGAMSPAFRESFETEARALGRLRHPNIVDVTDYGVDARNAGLPYLVMEYLAGSTLADILKKRKVLPFEEAIGLLRASADAVDTAHKNGIVHGDLKPSNLFLTEATDAQPSRLKVLDFGLALLTNPVTASAPDDDEATVSSAGGIRGTPAYMAPELLRYESASPASDRFAFGVLLYELLTGHTPFGRTLADLQGTARNAPAPPSSRNASLPPEIDAPVLALLAPDAAARPPSASAAVSAVARAWLAAEQRKWRSREWPRRVAIAAAATGLAVLLSAGAAQFRFVRVLEGRIADARFAWAPSQTPDPRLVLVALDDASLAADQRALADRADEFAAMIDRFFAAGARAVAIDLLLPARWSGSQEFAKAVATHADRLDLALFAAPSGDLVGPECLSPLTALVLGEKRYTELFGLANLEEDEDRTIRRARLSYVDKAGRRRASFAQRAVAAAFPGAPSALAPLWIDYSVRLNQLASISWKDVPARLQANPNLFRDRLVITGATYSASGDEHRVPPVASNRLVPGQLIQALIANTILEGSPIRDASLFQCLIPVGLACFVALAAALCFPRRFPWYLLVFVVFLLGYMTISFWLFRAGRTMLAVTGPELAILFSILAAVGLKAILSPYPMAEP